jgi:hypothetical protein
MSGWFGDLDGRRFFLPEQRDIAHDNHKYD